MSKPEKSIPITLDKERHVRFGYNQLCKLEDIGIPIAGLDKIMSDPGRLFTNIRTLLWVGLAHEDPTLTLDAVGEMIDTSRIGEMGEVINRAITAAFPAGDAKNEKGPETKT